MEIKSTLNLLREHERDHMSHMHAVAARTSSGVEEEWLPGSMSIEDSIQFATL
jgi:hypothetical protein